MLYIYVASYCRGCARAQQLAQQVQRLRPHVPTTVVHLDQDGHAIPANVIGTPMYLWNQRVLFMGNPELNELLERVDKCWVGS